MFVALFAQLAVLSLAASAEAAQQRSKPPGHPSRVFVRRHYGGATISLGTHITPSAPALHAAAKRSQRPAASPTNLSNQGGPVMSNIVIYNIYWIPSGTTTALNGGLIDQFTEDLGSPFVNMLAQYGVPNQLGFGGSWIDTKALPSGLPTQNGRPVLSDSDVQGVVTDAQNANAWQPPGLSTLYMVYIPSGTELCDPTGLCTYPDANGNALCAYHGSFVYSGSSTPNIYGAMPFDGDRMNGCSTQTITPGYTGSSGPNGDPANDSEISTASHEIFEAITDPEPTANPAWTGGNNPVDSHTRVGEIGDLCAYLYNPDALGDGGDLTMNAARYFIQYEWDNATSSCILPSGAMLPISTSVGCTANTLPANDDLSTGQVALPFSLNYFGSTYTSLWVNNNGNVTFNGPLGTFTPFPLLSTNVPIIAPYFADVDTRGISPVPSNIVTYGTTTFNGFPAFCVNWRNVGYFAAHTDKLDSFQLLLVDRTDSAPGDFDIVFNYDRVQWETGDASGGSGGLGGSTARAGFSNGTTNSLELFGSAVNGALLDSGFTALTASSHSSVQPGRYVFPVRNGTNAGGASISGQVTDPAGPVAGALVQACGGFTSTLVCDTATTTAQGGYSITSLPAGIYEVTVSPPAGSSLQSQTQLTVLLPNQAFTLNFSLTAPTPPPSGTTVGGASAGGIPVVFWQTATPLTTHGCSGGTGTFSITAQNSTTGQPQTVNGNLSETPPGSGTYTASIPSLYPLHGAGSVNVSITCPNPAQNSTFSFSIYIDPSGTVVDMSGNPVPGATVTLLRSDLPAGRFTVVPDGSPIMSPGNRTNPQLTDLTGTFGWDVMSGYYVIRAAKTGCSDPANPSQSYVQSPVMSIPPAVSGVQLTLDCPAGPPSAQITTPANGASFAQGQAVNASYSCAPAAGSGLLPGGQGCSGTVPNGSQIDTRTPGQHTFVVTATGLDGQTATATSSYTVRGSPVHGPNPGPTAQIARPANRAVYREGQVVLASYSCSAGPNGTLAGGSHGCTGTVPNGSPINTRTPGQHTFTVIAAQTDGQTASAVSTYTVTPPTVKITRARAAGRTARVTLSCRGVRGSTCVVRVALVVIEHFKSGKIINVTAASARHTSIRRVIVGALTVRVPAGRSMTATVPLNTLGRRLLAQFRRLQARTTASEAHARTITGSVVTFQKR